MTTDLDSQIDALPPSATYVYSVLERDEPLTHKELTAELNMPSRTIRWATTRLEDEGLITSERSTRDARQRVYEIAETGGAN